ncbi:MAG: Holliday junction branch migration protein RuvA, partial [Gammaproteobacteria bacterium]|nr:Holliday junction branch migration protein RuvA [Gammaproteobacteria bacterium]
MIGRIHGALISMQPPWLVIDVHGVGYEIEAPMTTIYTLPAVGSDVTLFTHYQVRDDAHLLYGFATQDERRLFRTLLKVSGVGAKLALTILSGIEANAFAQCVNEGNAAKLVQLPGVGKKTAERLIVEMRDRLDDWSLPAAGVD